jgi:hypothetical protein|tara:strand:+ start:7627 stop:7851 length:225 start_codon:yes stop_codon:yes gene_type:complete
MATEVIPFSGSARVALDVVQLRKSPVTHVITLAAYWGVFFVVHSTAHKPAPLDESESHERCRLPDAEDINVDFS